MLLSIITINFNNYTGLVKTMDSVLSQSNRNFEYIVIDGGSTDNSIITIKQNEQNISYWVSEKDRGVYDAMNKGIIQASGKYLMFLNSGDILSDSSCIELCLENINTNADVYYGDIWGTMDTTNTWIHTHPTDTKLSLAFFKTKNLNHQSSLIKANLFKEFGLYPKEYALAGDHWLYLKAFIADKRFKHINYPLVIFDYTGVGSVNRKLYEKEMEQMWDTLIPKYVQALVDKQQVHEDKINKKIYKIASWIDIKLFQLKQNIVFK